MNFLGLLLCAILLLDSSGKMAARTGQPAGPAASSTCCCAAACREQAPCACQCQPDSEREPAPIPATVPTDHQRQWLARPAAFELPASLAFSPLPLAKPFAFAKRFSATTLAAQVGCPVAFCAFLL